MKVLAAVVVALATMFATVQVADANSKSSAQGAADGFINALLPSNGQPGICDVKTQSGFFAKNASYLASCATNDQSFEAFSIVNAKNGSVNVNSPYVKSQLNTLCATGHAYSTGVKGKFANIYGGTDVNSAGIAQGLANALGQQISKTAGYVKPFKLC
jgi:hypothetical protein